MHGATAGVVAYRRALILGLGLALAHPAPGAAPDAREIETAASPAHGLQTWLMAARASITFTADAVSGTDLELRDVVVPIELRDGRAVIARGTATTNGGAVTFTGSYAVAARELHGSIRSEGVSLPARADAAAPATHLFAPVEFVPPWLPGLTGTLDMQLDRLAYAGTEATAINASAMFDPSRIAIELRGSLGGGMLTLEATHAYAAGATTLKAAVNALALDTFATVREYLSGATLDGTAELNASGRTVRELAASVDGRVRAQIGRGTLTNLQLERLSQNVLAMTLLSVIPFQHPAPQAPLECAALRLDLAHGRSAEPTRPVIVARSDKLELIGYGSLDLDREQIALKLQPASPSGRARVATGKPRTVSITGPLRAPVMTSKAGGLLHESLAIGASLAAKPLARAADRVFSRGGTQRSGCAAILGE